MTSSFASTSLRSPRRARRHTEDPLAAALLAAAAAGLVGLAVLWAVALPVASRPVPGTPRVALVVDAGGRPDLALARARAAASVTERAGAADVTVRVPRSASEAADVRYLAAHRDVTEIVVVGPAASAAARAAAADYPQARFAVRPTVPAALR